MDVPRSRVRVMRCAAWSAAVVAVTLFAASLAMAADPPLVLAKQGNFFVGGQDKSLGANNDITTTGPVAT